LFGSPQVKAESRSRVSDDLDFACIAVNFPGELPGRLEGELEGLAAHTQRSFDILQLGECLTERFASLHALGLGRIKKQPRQLLILLQHPSRARPRKDQESAAPAPDAFPTPRACPVQWPIQDEFRSRSVRCGQTQEKL